jgi:hypothetical protein
MVVAFTKLDKYMRVWYILNGLLAAYTLKAINNGYLFYLACKSSHKSYKTPEIAAFDGEITFVQISQFKLARVIVIESIQSNNLFFCTL